MTTTTARNLKPGMRLAYLDGLEITDTASETNAGDGALIEGVGYRSLHGQAYVELVIWGQNMMCLTVAPDVEAITSGTHCARHGEQTVTEQGSGPGFAGGTIYWAELSCGCFDVDEADDVAAAM